MRKSDLFLVCCFLLIPVVCALALDSEQLSDRTNGLFSSPNVRFNILTLGFGGLSGWAVGYTLKKFAKLTALVVGIAFISIQLLAYNHFLKIDWERIKQALPDEKIEQASSAFLSMITYNLPFASTFIVGFWFGFRKG